MFMCITLDRMNYSVVGRCVNPFAAEFFCYPPIATKIIFTYLDLAWSLFVHIYCMTPTFFVGTPVSQAEN